MDQIVTLKHLAALQMQRTFAIAMIIKDYFCLCRFANQGLNTFLFAMMSLELKHRAPKVHAYASAGPKTRICATHRDLSALHLTNLVTLC